VRSCRVLSAAGNQTEGLPGRAPHSLKKNRNNLDKNWFTLAETAVPRKHICLGGQKKNARKKFFPLTNRSGGTASRFRAATKKMKNCEKNKEKLICLC
jgi:hypothetical protein